MILEGEEEAGSVGFSECVKRNKVREIFSVTSFNETSIQDLIGHIDAILVSNSTWISEDRPCITYGLRGVIHCSVTVSAKAHSRSHASSHSMKTAKISSDRPDLHSGVDGGGVVEPMLDM